MTRLVTLSLILTLATWLIIVVGVAAAAAAGYSFFCQQQVGLLEASSDVAPLHTETMRQRRRLWTSSDSMSSSGVVSSADIIGVALKEGDLSARTLETPPTAAEIAGTSTSSSSSSLVDCPALLNAVHRSGTQWDPNDGTLYARYTKMTPQFWISLHNFDFDKVRYSTLQFGNYYEKALSKAFTDVLSKVPMNSSSSAKKRKLVIDVGGNIGWFSLLSAAMGHDVHVFEPYLINVIRLCESQCLNGWLNGSANHSDCTAMSPLYQPLNPSRANGVIHIRTLGLKDEAGDFWLSQNGTSPGAGRIGAHKVSEESIRVKVTTLDIMAEQLGWLHEDTLISILKVDVEGLEHDVFRGGHALIHSRRVQNIFMEGNVIAGKQVTQFLELVRDLQAAGYGVYKLGGYMGPTDKISVLPYPDNNHEKFHEGLLFGCKGFEQANRCQCNIWWKLKEHL